MKIRMPFKPEFMEPLREGKKLMTCRSEAMGEIGDTFDAFGVTFKLEGVYQVSLAEARRHYLLEGVDSPEAFEAIWKKIHPVAGFDPERIVWAHRFAKVSTEKPEEKK